MSALQQQQSSSMTSLIGLCQEYESAGWLTQRQVNEYKRLLRKHPESQEYVAKEIQRAVLGAKQKKPVDPPPQSTTVKSILHTPHDQLQQHDTSSHHRAVRWEDVAPEKDSLLENEELWPTCLEPSELNSVLTDESKIKELFAEMCFFARLGFVQPPSCLRCTYNKVMNRQQPANSSTPPCHRWVVWRKNADLLLHPDTLRDNIVMIQCLAVPKLLAGDEVDKRVWDTKRKQLVHTALV